MSKNTIVAKLKKSSVSEVWVAAKEYNNKVVCDIREYFHPADNAEWLPTKKGASIPPDLLGRAVDAVEEMARRDGVGEVCELPRGKNAKIRFAICEYQKHIYADIRTYYVEAGCDDWKPGKGVTIPLRILGQLAEALRLAEDHMEHQVAS
jgi:hypothetical protein